MSAKKKPDKKRPVDDNNLKIIFYLVLPLLFFPPFFRGLFFDYEAGIAHIYTALVLAAYILVRKDHLRLSRNIMDYAWVGLIAAYIISNFVAFNQRAALEGALRIFNFFVIYWLLAHTINSLNDIKTALAVMFTAGFGVALAGLGTAFGTFQFHGAYDKGLILSTLQYHNAAAIFLVACGIIGFYLTSVLDNIWWRVIAGGLNYIVIITAFGAGSRGAMLVAPVGLALLIAGMTKEYRLKVFLNFLAVLVPFVITAKQVLSFEVHSQGYYWGLLLIGLILGCGGQFIVEKFLSISAETRKKIIAGVGIGVTVLALGLILFLGSRIMPASIANRLANFNLQELSVVERFYFYRDALQLVKDYPVLGVGGGGWNSAYTGYQTFLYYTTEVHSHPLQVWVETGTLGFIFYVLIWIGLLVTIIKILREVESPGYRAAAWTAFAAAVSVSLHSVIDFSLSLGAVAILMYGLIGLVRGIERICFKEDKAQTKPVAGPGVRKAVGFTLAGILLIISGSLFLAATKERAAIPAYNSGNVQGAVALFEEAGKYDPLNFNYPMYLASLYDDLAYQQKNPGLAGTAVENAERAVSLNQKAAQPLWTLAKSYLVTGRPDKAVAKAEEAQRAVPWRQDGYENLARVYILSANQFIQKGQKEEARVVLNKVLDIPRLIQNQISELTPELRRIWTHGPMPEVNETIKKYLDEADKLLKTL